MPDLSDIRIPISGDTRRFERAMNRVSRRVDRFTNRFRSASFVALGFFGISQFDDLVEKLGETMMLSGGQAQASAQVMGAAIDEAKRAAVGTAQAVAIQFAPAITWMAEMLGDVIPKAAARTVNVFLKAKQVTFDWGATILEWVGAADSMHLKLLELVADTSSWLAELLGFDQVAASLDRVADGFGDRFQAVIDAQGNQLLEWAAELRTEAAAYGDEWDRAVQATELHINQLADAVTFEKERTKEQQRRRGGPGEFIEVNRQRTAFGVGTENRDMVTEQKESNRILTQIAVNTRRPLAVAG